MKFKKNGDKDRLILYIIISLILHLSILYFIPFGDFIGSAQEEGKGIEDFGFVQYVEIKPSPAQEPETTERESKKIEKEEPEEDAEEDESIPEEEKSQTEAKPENEKITIEENNSEKETSSQEETPPEPEDKSQPEQDVLASEESESEVKVQKEKQEPEKNEENEENQNNEEIKKEKEEEKKPEPPPPPTTGDLIGNMKEPYYPKDLMANRETGTVTLLADINTSGNINELKILNSSGIEKIDRVAELTIKNEWAFETYQKGYTMEIQVNFEINQEGDPDIQVDLRNLKFK